MDPISTLPAIVDNSASLIDNVDNAQTSALDATSGLAQATGSVVAGGDFMQTLTNTIGSLSGLQANADSAVAGLALNNGTDIHQAMIAMDQASLGMNLAVQVRNKAVEAYQSLLNMQM